MRGEYAISCILAGRCWELPPHARRIRDRVGIYGHSRGTTSACAENTVQALHLFSNLRNYLRMRGEYQAFMAFKDLPVELPPHARRIRTCATIGDFLAGTTSACAENTRSIGVAALAAWNYLRMRGEYAPPIPLSPWGEELPPHARRIPFLLSLGRMVKGTTSACAENTNEQIVLPDCDRNYLRMRGEYRKT